jgi:hypothetical protein
VRQETIAGSSGDLAIWPTGSPRLDAAKDNDAELPWTSKAKTAQEMTLCLPTTIRRSVPERAVRDDGNIRCRTPSRSTRP